MTLYFISGLGADERVFQKLQLPQQWHIRHLAWLTPLPREPLTAYSRRMAALIDTSQDFVVIGLSFGGIVAVELTHILHPKLTIILSSVSARQQLPAAFKILGTLKINRLVPSFLLNRIYPFTYWYLGVKTKEEKKLLGDIIKQTPPLFFKWAINEILNWKKNCRPEKLLHIHGTNDHIFPVKKTKADIKVAGGGHMMVYSKADEISRLLTENINKYL